MTDQKNNFAVVFPGQGSQQQGMLLEFAQDYPETLQLFKQASDILNYDLWDLIQNGPLDKLNQTEYTQPALLVSSIAIWNVYIKQHNLRPCVLAGHSLGEYSALVAAGSLDFADAVELVAARGRFMQEAVPAGTGAMAAILGLDNEQILAVIDNIDNVEIANLNAIGQTVIAGTRENVEFAASELKNAGAKLVKLLDVSVPSHCSLMQTAAEKLNELLKQVKFKPATIPVVHNYSVESYGNPDEIRTALYKQLTSPVRWVETINKINSLGVEYVYELGPGDVLSKLCKRINKSITAKAVNTKANLLDLVELLEN